MIEWAIARLNVTWGSMPIITRYFDQEIISTIKKDFKFLIDAVNRSNGELVFQIRGPKQFVVYYKGNSLAKIKMRDLDSYDISLHKKFISSKSGEEDLFIALQNFADPERSASSKETGDKDDYHVFTVKNNDLHKFLQSKHVKHLQSRIKAVNYKEELIVEQAILSDNMDSASHIIIDTEICDHSSNKRADFLALEASPENGPDSFKFLVIELKLGNNKELNPLESKNVLNQIRGYVDRLNTKEVFDEYKICYERSIAQRKAIGLNYFKTLPADFKILPGARGLIVVTHYMGIARPSLDKLKKLISSDIELKLITYKL